jgi:hypothetical protein
MAAQEERPAVAVAVVVRVSTLSLTVATAAQVAVVRFGLSNTTPSPK